MPTPLVLIAVTLAALAFQAHVFIDSMPLYLRYVAAVELPLLAPVFWVGFNLALLPFSLAARRWPAGRLIAAGTALAALAAVAARFAPSLPFLVTAQCIAGAGWAGAIVAAFAWATSRSARCGALAGALSSLLALATLIRMASVAAGWPKAPVLHEAIAWWPAAGLAGGWHAIYGGRRWRSHVRGAAERESRAGAIEGRFSLTEWNRSRYDPASTAGHYESWFQRANHPERPLAFWIRYTIFSPKGRPADAFGEIWAIFFDGERGRSC